MLFRTCYFLQREYQKHSNQDQTVVRLIQPIFIIYQTMIEIEIM